jgi:YibE/F-like protein
MKHSLGSRLGAAVPAVVIGLLLIVALWLLPDLTPQDAIPVVGQRTDHARIVAARGTDTTGLPRFEVELVGSGERLDAVVQDSSGALPGSSSNSSRYAVGDDVAVTQFSGPAGGDFAVIAEPWRLSTLGLAALLFAIAVMVVGGLRGARALIALALTLAVVVKLVVPLLLRGFDPILLAVAGAALVTVVTLLLTEGASRVTFSALLGTLVALTLTAGLAALFTGLAQFTQLQGNAELRFVITEIVEI